MASVPFKFLVDEMLQRLGHWLRAAGYDTVIATHNEADYYLLRKAIDSNRLLITKNSQIANLRSANERVVVLHSDSFDANVEEVAHKLDIDWTYKPFTRCVVCNTELTEASGQQAGDLPDLAQQDTYRVHYCPMCNQVYWDGSHAKRMQQNLSLWHDKYTF